jgi:hypothetical protein
MSSDPTPEESLDLILKALVSELKVMLPGRVESYDETTQTADVKPLLLDAYETESGVKSFELPVIPSVPVVFPRAGDYFMSFPLKADHYVMLVFCDRSYDPWWRSNGNVADPVSMHRHSIKDPVALVGFYPDQDKLADVHADNIVIGKDGGTQVHIKDGKIALGSESPSDALALAGLVKSELDDIKTMLDDIKTQYNLHTHPAPGGATSATAQSVTASYTASEPKSTVVDSE